MAVYANDGSIRVTVVDGSTFTGAQAPDGSIYVVVRTDEIGRYHSCGALLVTPISTNAAAGVLAPDGSLFVSESPYFQTSQKITVVSGSLGASIAAPAITWNSLETDYKPDFFIDLPSGNTDPTQDAAEGDRLIIEYQLQSGGSWTEYIDHPLTAGDITADTITVTGVGSVANGNYFFRARLERPSPALIGTNSANEGVTINAVSVPVNSVAPVISGNVQVGQTLTTTDGTWSNSPTGYTYQWKRDGSDISGATANTHVLVELDAGADITCAVTASNGSGSGSPATSNTLAIDVYLVFLAHIEDPTDHSSAPFAYSGGVWNSVSLGTAATNRKIIIAPAARSSAGGTAPVNSITVNNGGNISASLVIAGASGGGNNNAEIWIADVPTGTSGNLTVSFGATTAGEKNRCGAGVWAMYGAGSSTANATSKVEGAQNSGTVNLAVPAKGVAVGAAYHQTTGTATWTGLGPSGGRYDAALEGTVEHTGADLNSNAGGTIAMTSSWSAADTNGIHVFASWGP